jgi:hypothetical protein
METFLIIVGIAAASIGSGILIGWFETVLSGEFRNDGGWLTYLPILVFPFLLYGSGALAFYFASTKWA